MPRVLWPLRHGRPCVEAVLSPTAGGQPIALTLLADTGAGSRTASFEFILHQAQCLLCGALLGLSVTLAGAYAGTFPLYGVRIRLPALGFAQDIRAVGVPAVSPGFDGTACFGFLDRFTYGNFGDPNAFGLEC